jgi:hypothetical protein
MLLARSPYRLPPDTLARSRLIFITLPQHLRRVAMDEDALWPVGLMRRKSASSP